LKQLKFDLRWIHRKVIIGYMSNIPVKTKKIDSEIKNLRREVGVLRSAIISILGRDREGKYRPEFVKEVLLASKETPTGRFTNTDSFLKELK